MRAEIGISYGTYCEDPSGKPTRGWFALLSIYLCYANQELCRPKIEAFATRTAQAPLLGLFGAFVKDWIPLIDEYHYCEYVPLLITTVLIDTTSIRYCTLVTHSRLYFSTYAIVDGRLCITMRSHPLALIFIRPAIMRISSYVLCSTQELLSFLYTLL